MEYQREGREARKNSECKRRMEGNKLICVEFPNSFPKISGIMKQDFTIIDSGNIQWHSLGHILGEGETGCGQGEEDKRV